MQNSVFFCNVLIGKMLSFHFLPKSQAIVVCVAFLEVNSERNIDLLKADKYQLNFFPTKEIFVFMTFANRKMNFRVKFELKNPRNIIILILIRSHTYWEYLWVL